MMLDKAGKKDLDTSVDELIMVTQIIYYHHNTVHLTIIPRAHVGNELLDNGRGANHRVGYNKLISNKREWNNCSIKYQTLDKTISNYIFYRLEFSAILWKNFP